MTISTSALQQLVEAALLAPSGDNTQPFRFEHKGNQLVVYVIHERARALINFKDWGTWMALGAAVANLEIRATHLNIQANALLSPSPSSSKPVARIRLVQKNVQKDPLNNMLGERCTNRRFYRIDPLPAVLKKELLSIARKENTVRLEFIEDRDKMNAVADIASQFDKLFFEHPILLHDLQKWIRWTSEETERTLDGMPVETFEVNVVDQLGLKSLRHPFFQKMFQNFHLGFMMARRTNQLYRKSGAYALLTANDDKPLNFFKAGKVMQRLWLTLNLHGWAFQPMSGFIFLNLYERSSKMENFTESQREFIRDNVGKIRKALPSFKSRTPVMMFRTGQAPAPSGRTLRRRVEDVLQ